MSESLPAEKPQVVALANIETAIDECYADKVRTLAQAEMPKSIATLKELRDDPEIGGAQRRGCSNDLIKLGQDPAQIIEDAIGGAKIINFNVIHFGDSPDEKLRQKPVVDVENALEGSDGDVEDAQLVETDD